MKCPMMLNGVLQLVSQNKAGDCDCLQAECAWWEKRAEKCGILLIEHQLHGIRAALFDIEGKLKQEVDR